VAAQAAEPLVVGSKRFTESYILGEIASQTLTAAGVDAQHKAGLGNTGILEQALASGAVDIYPEYTGTIVRELLKRTGNPSLEELNRWLAPRRPEGRCAIGLQQHLCASDARSPGTGPWRSQHLGPGSPAA
jgi:osmoprotectant transport system permease protein